MKQFLNIYECDKPVSKSKTFFVTGTIIMKNLFLLFILLSFQTLFGQVAPVIIPSGGFAIDGGLKANTPTVNIGDWFPGPGGSGGSVFDASANPIIASTTGRKTDPYNSSSDDIFTTGSKFNDYVGNLHWTSSSAPDKNDINNALYHVARDANNNQWAFIAGDRLSTNGTSYIDFEFLQGSVTKNSDGTFTGTPLTSKPNGGGRTQGDMIISMQYTNGGTKPLVFIYQWQLSGGTWSYQLANITNLDANAFAETNRTGAETGLLYTAFGTNTYAQFSFVEAAINITYLISQLNSGNVCAGLNINTLWVKTKASASSTAALKDFIAPIPVNFQFGQSSITPAGPFCLNASAVTLTATPSGGTFTGDGVSSSGLFTPSAAGVGSHVISYSASGCTATDTIIVNPVASITTPSIGAVCAGSTTASVSYASATATQYKIVWNSAAHTAGLTDITYTNLPASPFNITIPSTLATGTYSGTIYVTNAAGCESAGNAISLTVNGNPTASAGTAPAAQCSDAVNGNTFSLSGSGTNGTPSWSVQTNTNNLGVVFTNGNTFTPSVKVTGGTGSVTLRLTVTSSATPSCGNQTSDVTITVNPVPTASAGTAPAAQCYDAVNGNTFSLSGSGTNGTPSWSVQTNTNNLGVVFTNGNTFTPSVKVTGGTGSVILRLTVTSSSTPSCGNQTSDVTVSVTQQPSAPDASMLVPTCTDKTFSVQVNSPVSGTTYTLTQPGNSNPPQTINYTGTGNVIFTGLTFGDGFSVTATNNASGCVSAANTCGSTTSGRKMSTTSTMVVQPITIEEPLTKVTAAPNPFGDNIRFSLQSAVSGEGTLELYNILGQKVKTVFQGYVQKGQIKTIDYSVPGGQHANLIYLFKVGNERKTGILIGVK